MKKKVGLSILIILASSVSVAASEMGADISNLCINEVQVGNLDRYLDHSYNFGGWIEIFNPTDSIYSLTGCYLSDDESNLRKHKFSFLVLKPFEYVVFYFGHYSSLATSQIDLNLDPDGGSLFISNRRGKNCVECRYPESIARTSWARIVDGSEEWAYTDEPTLNQSNHLTIYCEQRLDEPQPSITSRLFTSSIRFTVPIPAGTVLRYTTDGSVPTVTNGMLSETGEFSARETTIFRFRLFADGCLASPVVTRSFIKTDRMPTIPVSSVTTDRRFLYDDYMGIMVVGKNGIEGLGSTSNWNRDWDRVANFELIQPDGTVTLNQEVQMSICGGWTRRFTPRSFKLKADKECGEAYTYPAEIFASDPHLRQKAVRLRAGGHDEECRFMDAAVSVVIKTSGMDLDVLSYQPVLSFLNGEYQGLVNMRETSGKQYVKTHFGYDDEEIDMFEFGPGEGKNLTSYGFTQTLGTKEALDRLYDLACKSDVEGNFEQIVNLLDMDEYINFMATQVYMGNHDWANHDNNVKAWRPREENGRYRFTAYDFDQIFYDGVFDYFAKDETILNLTTGRVEDDIFKNLFSRLCANSTFRKRFIDSFCLVSGSVFEQQRVTAVIDSLVADVEQSFNQWDGKSKLPTANRIKANFTDSRASTMHTKMRAYAPLKASSLTKIKTSFTANIPEARLFLNGIPVPTNRFTGRLYLPATLRAVAPHGYRFVGWKQLDADNTPRKILWVTPEYKLTTSTPSAVIACFERVATYKSIPHVVINEVCASNEINVNDYDKKADWLELYNNSEVAVDISDYVLKVKAKDGTIKESMLLPVPELSMIMQPHEKRIVWCDGMPGIRELHASFKLPNDTTLLMCIPPSDTAEADIFSDSLLYVPHRWNESVGRYPDGGMQCYIMTKPTIDAPNRFTYYTKPFDEQMLREEQNCSTSIEAGISIPAPTTVFDLQGRSVSIDAIPSGIYIVNGKKQYVRTMK